MYWATSCIDPIHYHVLGRTETTSFARRSVHKSDTQQLVVHYRVILSIDKACNMAWYYGSFTLISRGKISCSRHMNGYIKSKASRQIRQQFGNIAVLRCDFLEHV